ncbi:ATP-binding protein [Saccharopolyspora erythraea]|uniref:ATP-binding protein n=1 Tax=Saccharopolyspora erythraea TaxID=1836 RepID=UPI001BAC1926|nr:ATP-binding protein [Saccharopolyspora erythraea]QUH03834.1 ATP-binding protein [Saccharopolyspora erythraea]
MVERIPWDELEPAILDHWGWPGGKWQPEHMAVLGPTGSGKSYFATHLLHQRVTRSGAHAIIVATKPADSTMTRMARQGWVIRRTWPPDYGQNRVIYWPTSGKPSEGIARQRQAVFEMLDELWKPDANVIIQFDEIAYIEHELKLSPLIAKYWRESRALGITLMAMTQRPRFVSRYMHSEPSWSVAFRPDDEDDAARVAEVIGGRRKYKPILLDLEPHEFLIVRRRKREAYISKLPG